MTSKYTHALIFGSLALFGAFISLAGMFWFIADVALKHWGAIVLVMEVVPGAAWLMVIGGAISIISVIVGSLTEPRA